jgi:nucleotide-binding universal stress UspA family protein
MSHVILATDLSEASGIAERLVCSIPWPAETRVTVVTVVPWLSDVLTMPWLTAAPLHDEEAEATEVMHARRGAEDAAARLRTAGIDATAIVMRGPAADAIVDVAETQQADLIVVGSRGLGAIEGALLGSVSEAVSDRAPCPVLIARTDRIDRSLIACDGSEGATDALGYVREHRHLLGAETRIVAVFNRANLWAETPSLPVDAHSVQVLADDELALEATTRDAVHESAAALRNAGQHVDAVFLEGAPGPTLVGEALRSRSDLVIVGTHHRKGLRRIVMGSVGRHVLHHAHCSVLQVGWLPVPARSEAPELVSTAR